MSGPLPCTDMTGASPCLATFLFLSSKNWGTFLHRSACEITAPRPSVHRQQGIGRELVRRLVDRAGPATAVLLVTVYRRKAFYERCGFREVPPGRPLPGALGLERALGSVYARLVAGEEVLVMEHVKK